jgi:hypothetical protein
VRIKGTKIIKPEKKFNLIKPKNLFIWVTATI